MADNPLARIIEWLRAGYPQGIPQGDYVALLGVLHRSLTDEEVERVALDLRRATGLPSDGVEDEVVRQRIRELVLEQPAAEDVDRVMARLDEGWRHEHGAAGDEGPRA